VVGLYCAAIALLSEYYFEVAIVISVMTIPWLAHVYGKKFPRQKKLSLYFEFKMRWYLFVPPQLLHYINSFKNKLLIMIFYKELFSKKSIFFYKE